MNGRRGTAMERGEQLGWSIVNGNLPRAVTRAWKDRALGDRQEARQRGVRGALRNLDTRVKGERGKAVPSGHFANALEAARLGIPMESAFGRAVHALSATYSLAYQQHEREQRGPKAS